MANTTGYFIGGAILGLIVGGIGGAIIIKKKCDKDTEAQIQQMADEIAKVDPYAPGNYKSPIIPVKMETEKTEDTHPIVVTSISEKEMEQTIKDFQKEIKDSKKVDYTAAYDGRTLKEKQEKEFELMKELAKSDEEDEDEDHTTVDFHSRADLHSDPIIITADEAGDVPDNYESEVLFYYVQNDALVDEYDEEIDEPERAVGNLLETSGYKKNMDRHIYIKNPRLNVIYDIEKVFKLWEGKEGGV